MPKNQILIRPLAEKGEPRVFLESGSNTSARFRIFDPEFSPDSNWITYTSTETGAREVYIRAFLGPGEKHRISTIGGMNPALGGKRPRIILSGASHARRLASRIEDDGGRYRRLRFLFAPARRMSCLPLKMDCA